MRTLRTASLLLLATFGGSASADETPAPDRGPNELTSQQLAALVYQVEVVSSSGVLGEREDTRAIRQRPRCGLRVADGFLLGGSRGEWGGELVFSDGKASAATVLVRENTKSIHELPFGILAVTGLAHMSLNRGALYLVQRLGPKRYRASRWLTLPAAPRRTGLLADGSLFVECIGGAQVVVTPSGQANITKP
jgi:hypothetical protein